MAAVKPALRAVAPDEKPEPPKKPEAPEPKKDLGWALGEAIVKGDRLQIEYAQRRDIARKLDDASGPAAAALHRQLSLTNDKIEALESKASQEAKAESAAVSDEAFDPETI